MNITHRRRFAATFAGTAALAAAFTIATSAAAPRFFDDDPIWQERDTEDESTGQARHQRPPRRLHVDVHGHRGERDDAPQHRAPNRDRRQRPATEHRLYRSACQA